MTRPIEDTLYTLLARMLRPGWNLIQAGILVYGLAVTGYLLARLTVGERWSWIAYANNFIPWWALGNTILVGIALISGRRWLLIACQLPGIITFLLLYGELLLPRNTPAEATARAPITVATYNILSSTSDPARIKDVIMTLNADVIGLVELGPDHTQFFTAELAEQYPYQTLHPRSPFHGVGLLSRYPILREDIILPFVDSMSDLRTVLDIDGQHVTVYVVHPARPSEAISPFTYNDDRRDAEITILCDDYLAYETGPLIVLGDFNMSDQSNAYRRVDDLLDDAFREAGRGMGFTFPDALSWSVPHLPLLVRIDYVWHNDDFTAHDAFVAKDSGTSDHRPMVAQLELNTEKLQANILSGR
jgi:vancomycin resistance protein VanJ